ncbi:disease resistance protein RGA2-like [Zingiber officinale]|uniref:disease resistance protein RGA2-like n=1 Tax=Zingiber officinale TaxID=94328 RepID=UPI001C4DA66B|nr:disease resistance protein RGA2-like [Zingiber officinale]
MSDLTKVLQTEIAIHLTELLWKRTHHVIKSLRMHRKSKVLIANSGLEELLAFLRYNWFSMTDYLYNKISNKFLQDWLWRFDDFFYMTEDVLDDFEFMLFPSDKPQGRDDFSAFDEAMQKLPEVIDTAADLFLEITDFRVARKEFPRLSYEEVMEMRTILKRPAAFEQVQSRVEKPLATSSGLPTLPYEVRELKGRVVEKNKILEALFHRAEGESKKLPISISISGPVGIGKTDLARAVYNSAQVEAEFDVRAWIYMGNHHLDKWLTLQRSESDSVDQPSKLHRSSILDILNILETEMTAKKVLIVLDNLEGMGDEVDVNNIIYQCRRKGARIIVTTQSEDVGRLSAVWLNVELNGLEEEDYLELFKECALGDRNRNKYPELENIVGEIAKRFGGNPLAAVMIGRHLKWHQSEDRWRIISRSNLGMIDPTESNILSVLRHSYEKLPGDQKQCYLACALFPKNYPFKQNQLFKIWKAIGCCSHISNQSSWTWKNIEPFFVSSARKDGEFILHAIFHELADYICDGEFFRLEDEIKEEDDVVQIPDKARHVYVTADYSVKVYRVLQEKTHLRSLVIGGVLSSEEHKSSFMGWLEEVLRNLKGLRLLLIYVLPSGKLPDAIGGLRHLQYLELPIDTITKESIQELPAWLSDNRFVGLRRLLNLKALREAILKKGSIQEHPTW